MENNRLAKKVISVLLDQEVEELTLGQQETLVSDEKRGLTLFRLDFKAVIKEPDGSMKKVLIELQKSKYPTDIQRFRTYLGSNYLKPDKITKAGKRTVKESYPIITIYILGYNLDDLPYMAVTVNREIINSVNKKRVFVNSFFIEHLTHQSHVIQVLRLPEKRRTNLEKFLTLFNQAWITEYNYILDLKGVPKEFEDIVKYLRVPVMDEDFRRQLEAEEEIDTIFDQQEAKYLEKIEQVKQREEQAKQREEQAKQSEKQAKQREKEERKQKKVLAIKLAKQMKKNATPLQDIIKEIGLTQREIEKL